MTRWFQVPPIRPVNDASGRAEPPAEAERPTFRPDHSRHRKKFNGPCPQCIQEIAEAARPAVVPAPPRLSGQPEPEEGPRQCDAVLAGVRCVKEASHVTHWMPGTPGLRAERPEPERFCQACERGTCQKADHPPDRRAERPFRDEQATMNRLAAKLAERPEPSERPGHFASCFETGRLLGEAESRVKALEAALREAEVEAGRGIERRSLSSLVTVQSILRRVLESEA